MLKKNIIYIVLFLSTYTFGQRISVQTNIGFLSGLNYKFNDFESNLNFSNDFGVNLEYYFTDRFSIETGLHYGNYATSFNIPESIVLKSNEIDASGSAFELRTSVKGYKEKSTISTVMIPLMLRHEIPINTNKTTKFYAATGIKYIITAGQKTNTKIGELSIEGYYPDTNLIIDDLPSSGFGSVYNFNSDNNKKQLDKTLALCFESGVSFLLRKATVYTGLYVNYGLSDYKRYKENTTETIVEYDPYKIATKASSFMGLKGVNNIHFLSVGISLRVVIFNLSKKKKLLE